MAEQTGLFPSSTGGDYGSETQAGVSRRDFVKGASFLGIGVVSGVRLLSTLTDKKPILVDSKGVLFHDPTRCVSCRRCELACSEFRDGAASSYLARVKVGRNLNATTHGANFKYATVEGNLGNGRVTADTCKQCPHPVPCAEACPAGAITADPTTGARKINTTLCIGCGICTTACPWAIPVVNPTTKKAIKCDLCQGKPECARACPTGALRYVKWRDLRLSTPLVQPSLMPATTTTDCSRCHK